MLRRLRQMGRRRRHSREWGTYENLESVLKQVLQSFGREWECDYDCPLCDCGGLGFSWIACLRPVDLGTLYPAQMIQHLSTVMSGLSLRESGRGAAGNLAQPVLEPMPEIELHGSCRGGSRSK